MTITPGDMPEYRDMRTADARLYTQPHWRVEKDQPPNVVYPAYQITFGSQRLGSSDTLHPQLILYALEAKMGLSFIPTADELVALGQSFLDFAERMRADARDQASAAIEKARQSGGSAS